MTKKYLYIFLLLLTISFTAQSQSAKNSGIADALKTENLLEKTQIYPNPVTNGKLFINTETNTPKNIELYDMLGKRVLITETNSYQRELNLGTLKAGVYLIKITEKGNSITRKIVLK